jgi:hypothetical protein
MECSDLKTAPLESAGDADAAAAAATEFSATDREREDNGLDEVKRMMAEVKSARPK